MLSSYSTFTSIDFFLPPAAASLPYRNIVLDLCNRQANQNKQIIIFMPTKSSCRKAVDDLIHYIDSTFPEQPGILSESVPEKVMKERREVIQVLF